MPILDPPDSLMALPGQPGDVDWPTTTWSTGPVPTGVDPDRLADVIDEAFGPDPDPRFGESHAVIIVHRGRIVAERYGPGIDESAALGSWSMAKSITHALAGILVAQGRLDPFAPAAVEEWSNSSDSRSEITLHHMLRMVDGLDFNESYAIPDDPDADVAFSHCIDMLFGSGMSDHAAYAAARPAAHRPDTVFNYSSGTTNIIARIIGETVGPERLASWMADELFTPIGMTSAEPIFDEAGNFVGSSYVNATARDWARFGLLYLRGGHWDGRQVVPASWVDDGRTPRAIDDGDYYGAHWWVADDGRGRFYASGFEYQRVACVPSSDLVAVRLGKTAEADYEVPKAWFEKLIALFDSAD